MNGDGHDYTQGSPNLPKGMFFKHQVGDIQYHHDDDIQRLNIIRLADVALANPKALHSKLKPATSNKYCFYYDDDSDYDYIHEDKKLSGNGDDEFGLKVYKSMNLKVCTKV